MNIDHLLINWQVTQERGVVIASEDSGEHVSNHPAETEQPGETLKEESTVDERWQLTEGDARPGAAGRTKEIEMCEMERPEL